MNGKKTKKKVVKIIGLAIFMVGMGGILLLPHQSQSHIG